MFKITTSICNAENFVISHSSGITLTFSEVMRYYFSLVEQRKKERNLNESPFGIKLSKIHIWCYIFETVDLNFSPTEIPQHLVLLKPDLVSRTPYHRLSKYKHSDALRNCGKEWVETASFCVVDFNQLLLFYFLQSKLYKNVIIIIIAVMTSSSKFITIISSVLL